MIDIKEIEKLAALSRITLTPEEKIKFQKEIDSILSYINQIQQVSGDVKEPQKNIFNVMRSDDNALAPRLYTEKILANTPKREGDFVKVKKIL
jgi:aspartyl-tRNA(Asn)/glutamyl-tRNA(Gln) amidotransferase subunit C